MIAYLIERHGRTLKDALAQVSAARSVAKPNKGSKNVGAIMFKRVVVHPHTTNVYVDQNGNDQPVHIADVFKVE